MCNHKWKQYQGFTETYTNCELCGVKKEDYDVELDKISKQIGTINGLFKKVYADKIINEIPPGIRFI
jgi:hypothetical protein